MSTVNTKKENIKSMSLLTTLILQTIKINFKIYDTVLNYA